MKKRLLLPIVIAALLLLAFVTKPDDKTCIIKTVHAVWGSYVPDPKLRMYYEPFMDNASKAVVINDWVFLKRLGYMSTKGTRTIGIGAFNRVFIFG